MAWVAEVDDRQRTTGAEITVFSLDPVSREGSRAKRAKRGNATNGSRLAVNPPLHTGHLRNCARATGSISTTSTISAIRATASFTAFTGRRAACPDSRSTRALFT
jgi:hypothetical protein